MSSYLMLSKGLYKERYIVAHFVTFCQTTHTFFSQLWDEKIILIIAVIGTHDDESDRVVMEVLKDVIKDDLE